MTMLLLIFRQSLEQDLHQLLADLEVKAFTQAPKILGMGEAGSTFNSFPWPGHNCMIIAALEDPEADKVVKRLREFRDDLARRQKGAKIPMRVFAFPCTRLI